ncbi:MAG TPA: hypothetical protein P5145_06660 [Tenuifilaceae bacterium]|nr:hypothetical protein [Tenuifilaceae bacterium]
MLKHQILISFIVIAVAVWIAFKIRDKRKSRNDEGDTTSES